MIDPKTLSTPDWQHIYNLVNGILETIKYDDTGVTDDLIDEALVVSEILKITPVETGDEDE